MTPNNWRQLFRMAVVVLLCVCVVMCFALAVSYAEEGAMAGCAVCSAMVVVFLACAARMASMIESKKTASNSSLKEMIDEADKQIAKLKELKN